MRDEIKITDWAGNQLYIGPYNDPDVDKILDINRDEEGYCEDIEVEWNSDREDNVYEYINW